VRKLNDETLHRAADKLRYQKSRDAGYRGQLLKKTLSEGGRVDLTGGNRQKHESLQNEGPRSWGKDRGIRPEGKRFCRQMVGWYGLTVPQKKTSKRLSSRLLP